MSKTKMYKKKTNSVLCVQMLQIEKRWRLRFCVDWMRFPRAHTAMLLIRKRRMQIFIFDKFLCHHVIVNELWLIMKIYDFPLC